MNLESNYDNELEQKMADLASIVRILNSEDFETDGEGLFALLVRGTCIYVEAWAKDPDDDSLGALFVHAEDMADPSRANDPNAAFITKLNLALEAIHDNIRCELDPKYGQWIPDDPSSAWTLDDPPAESEQWWTISGDDLLAALYRVKNGDDPEVVYMEFSASEEEPDGSA